MKQSTKNKLANSLGMSPSFNKKVLSIKSSWDTVDSILQSTNIGHKKSKQRSK